MRNGWGRYVYKLKDDQQLIEIEEGEWIDDEFRGIS
jgi:hypothetical protein